MQLPNLALGALLLLGVMPVWGQPMGVGMVWPERVAGDVLYFYLAVEPDRLPAEVTPVDSLVFVVGAHFVDVQAPPWVWPEVMKLDYDLLAFRAHAVTRNWIEVVVNQRTGETRWVDRAAVRYVPWPDFWLDVVAVEPIPENVLRAAPLPEAPPVEMAPDAVLRPLVVRGAWMQVAVHADLGGPVVGTAWLRWHDGSRLLITYALLS